MDACVSGQCTLSALEISSWEGKCHAQQKCSSFLPVFLEFPFPAKCPSVAESGESPDFRTESSKVLPYTDFHPSPFHNLVHTLTTDLSTTFLDLKNDL